MKKIPNWKIKRQEQIEMRVIITLFVIALLFGAYALGSTVMFELTYGKAIVEGHKRDIGLYAGITDIDFSTVDVVENEVDKVESVNPDSEPYSDDDLELLAKVIYRETGNQGELCMYYCGSVILNRIKSDKYQDNLYDVVFQHKGNRYQYSVAKNKSRLMNTEPSYLAYKVAKDLSKNGTVVPEYVLYQHGNNTPVKGTKVYKRINGEVYSYDR